MHSRARLEQLFAELTKAGANLASDIHHMATPGGGVGFYLIDPHNRRLRITADVAENADAKPHFAMPTKVSHVVLNSPDLHATEAFYSEMLGFRLSDYYVDRMSFMRCSQDHHSIGLMQNVHSSVNHVAFEMPDMDSYMRGIGRLKQNAQVPSWGPGRHGPGNNPFAYFVSPSGFVIEYTCELDQIDEAAHKAKEWTWGDAETGDRWMTAGPATPAMRAIMLGRPDPGHPGKGAA
jgi:catechol 2,3-dioxygenase-like lactoylglutathione lyase family enzyme